MIDVFSNFSLNSRILLLFDLLTPLRGLLSVCWLSKIDLEGYIVGVVEVVNATFCSCSKHARRLWQFSATNCCTMLSGTLGNSCFISWNNCIMLIFEHEHALIFVMLLLLLLLLFWSIRSRSLGWSIDFEGIWSMLSHSCKTLLFLLRRRISSGKFLSNFPSRSLTNFFLFLFLLFAAISFLSELKIELVRAFFTLKSNHREEN